MDAVIYLRVSTKEQAAKDESGEGYSIPANGRFASATSSSAGGTWLVSSSTPASPPELPTARC